MTIHLVRLFALFAGTQVRSFFFPRVDQRALHDARCCCELASAHAAKLAGFWGQEKKRSKWTRCLGAPNTCWPAPCALGTFPPCSWFGVRERHTPHAPLATRKVAMAPQRPTGWPERREAAQGVHHRVACCLGRAVAVWAAQLCRHVPCRQQAEQPGGGKACFVVGTRWFWAILVQTLFDSA